MTKCSLCDAIVDGIPGLGHVKGLYHFARGNKEAGKRAMVEATRSSVACLGGVIGALGGPVGVAVGAASAGFAMDTAISVTTGESSGYLKGIQYIVNDLEKGRFPLSGLVHIAACFGFDVCYGHTAVGVVGFLAQSFFGKAAALSLGKKLALLLGDFFSLGLPAQILKLLSSLKYCFGRILCCLMKCGVSWAAEKNSA